MASRGIPFNPATDIPSLAGKVIVVTGANSGLGRQASLELARHKPAQLWMACRNLVKGREAVEHVKRDVPEAAVELLELDLADFDSIKSAARTILVSSSRLDILMLNAGLMGCPPALTKQGYEVQMGTNHVGHALLLDLLTPLLAKTPSARVVVVSSAAFKHVGPDKIQLDTVRSPDACVTPVDRYIQSKAANVLYAQEFARHHPGLTVVSADPGAVDTGLFRREPGDAQMARLASEEAPKVARPVDEGVRNQLWAATAPGADVVSGAHYEPVGVLGEPRGLQLDEDMARRLWDWTRKELSGHYGLTGAGTVTRRRS